MTARSAWAPGIAPRRKCASPRCMLYASANRQKHGGYCCTLCYYWGTYEGEEWHGAECSGERALGGTQVAAPDPPLLDAEVERHCMACREEMRLQKQRQAEARRGAAAAEVQAPPEEEATAPVGAAPAADRLGRLPQGGPAPPSGGSARAAEATPPGGPSPPSGGSARAAKDQPVAGGTPGRDGELSISKQDSGTADLLDMLGSECPNWTAQDFKKALEKLRMIGIINTDQLRKGLMMDNINSRLEILNRPTFSEGTLKRLKRKVLKASAASDSAAADELDKRFQELERSIHGAMKGLEDQFEAKQRELEDRLFRRIDQTLELRAGDLAAEARDLQDKLLGRNTRSMEAEVRKMEKRIQHRLDELLRLEELWKQRPEADLHSPYGPSSPYSLAGHHSLSGSPRYPGRGAESLSARHQHVGAGLRGGGHAAHREEDLWGAVLGRRAARGAAPAGTAARSERSSWDGQSRTIADLADEMLPERLTDSEMKSFVTMMSKVVKGLVMQSFQDARAQLGQSGSAVPDSDVDDMSSPSLAAWTSGNAPLSIAASPDAATEKSFKLEDIEEAKRAATELASEFTVSNIQKLARQKGIIRALPYTEEPSAEPPCKTPLDASSERSAAPQWKLRERHCFLPGTLLCAMGGERRSIEDVKPGDSLAGGEFQPAVVKKITRIGAESKRTVVECDYRVGNTRSSFSVTGNHPVPTLHRGARRYIPMPANDLKQGDRIRIFSVTGSEMEGEIEMVSVRSMETSCYQLEFKNSASTVFVAMADQPKDIFAELYGELAPRGSKDWVKCYRFRHFNKFEELLKDEELAVYARRLEEAGHSHDLTKLKLGLGPGKMFVEAEIAEYVIQALRKGPPLVPRNIVVSRKTEKAVLEAVERLTVKHKTRKNWCTVDTKVDFSRSDYMWRSDYLWLQEGPLHSGELGHFIHDPLLGSKDIVVEDRTFIDIRSPEDAPSVVTQSTADKRKIPGEPYSSANPRRRPLVSERRG